jgi:fructose-bisphosphate aldolase class 1
MMNHDTENTARTLVADGKGILAADETPGTLTRRFDSLGIGFTEQAGARIGKCSSRRRTLSPSSVA